MVGLAQVLEAAEALTAEERLMLMDLLHKREIERRRDEIAAEIAQAEREYAEGRAKAMTPRQIVDEILSCDEN